MKYLLAFLSSLLLFAGAPAPDLSSRSPAADEFQSGITGRLTDSNGAVVAGATVRVTARSTKKVLSFSTDDKGEYAADLGPDVYDVEADAAGFKKAKRKAIPVVGEARSYVDFVLEPEPPNDPRHP